MGLPPSTNYKDDGYDSILVIIDWLIKIVHYELVKMIINASDLAKIILHIVVQLHNLHNSIVGDRSSVFTSEF